MAKNSKTEKNMEDVENKSNLVGYVRRSNAGGAIKVPSIMMLLRNVKHMSPVMDKNMCLLSYH